MSEFSVDWTALLVDAVNKPGIISTAYNRFWCHRAPKTGHVGAR